MKVTLTAMEGPLKGVVAEFVGPGSFLIGRARDADFRLPEEDPSVSRRHVYLEVLPPRCRVRDIGTTGFRSTNPPKVNGQRVNQEHELQDGDRLELGCSRFLVSFHSDSSGLICLYCGGAIEPLEGGSGPLRCPVCFPSKQVRKWAEGTTVLAVEDDPLTAKLIRATLEKEGLRVLEARHGREGLALLQGHRVDLMSTDLMMPAMDGIRLIREVRELLPQTKGKIPILVLSENGGEDEMLRCLAAGADDYLAKPFSPQVYLDKLWRFYLHIRR